TLWFVFDACGPHNTSLSRHCLAEVCLTAVEVLALKFVSPPKEAVMIWLPTAKLELLKLAVVVPPLVLSAPWPMLTPPSAKITTRSEVRRVGNGSGAGKVTYWPHTDVWIDDA